MICEMCGDKNTHIKKVTRSYDKGKRLLVIENVPVVRCLHCGSSYLTAATLHEIEQIKLHQDGYAHKRVVPVAEFADVNFGNAAV